MVGDCFLAHRDPQRRRHDRPSPDPPCHAMGQAARRVSSKRHDERSCRPLARRAEAELSVRRQVSGDIPPLTVIFWLWRRSGRDELPPPPPPPPPPAQVYRAMRRLGRPDGLEKTR